MSLIELKGGPFLCYAYLLRPGKRERRNPGRGICFLEHIRSDILCRRHDLGRCRLRSHDSRLALGAPWQYYAAPAPHACIALWRVEFCGLLSHRLLFRAELFGYCAGQYCAVAGLSRYSGAINTHCDGSTRVGEAHRPYLRGIPVSHGQISRRFSFQRQLSGSFIYKYPSQVYRQDHGSILAAHTGRRLYKPLYSKITIWKNYKYACFSFSFIIDSLS